jgi:hypothetical protein
LVVSQPKGKANMKICQTLKNLDLTVRQVQDSVGLENMPDPKELGLGRLRPKLKIM